jgi:hypothetical protein
MAILIGEGVRVFLQFLHTNAEGVIPINTSSSSKR